MGGGNFLGGGGFFGGQGIFLDRGIFLGAGDFLGKGIFGGLEFLCTNLLVRVKLGYPSNFNFLGKPLLGEKYVHGKKKKERKRTIMPSLVATTSTPARKPFVRTHQFATNAYMFVSFLTHIIINQIYPSI